MGWGTWDHGEWSALQRQVLDDQAKEGNSEVKVILRPEGGLEV